MDCKSSSSDFSSASSESRITSSSSETFFGQHLWWVAEQLRQSNNGGFSMRLHLWWSLTTSYVSSSSLLSSKGNRMYYIFRSSERRTSTYRCPCLGGSFYWCSQLDEELAHLHLVIVHLGRHLKKTRSEIVSQQVIPTVIHVQRFPFSRPSQGLASIMFIFIGWLLVYV